MIVRQRLHAQFYRFFLSKRKNSTDAASMPRGRNTNHFFNENQRIQLLSRRYRLQCLWKGGRQKKSSIGGRHATIFGFGETPTSLFFGAADRSGRGKCCSSSSCCCWGIWGTVFRSPMYTQNGCIQRKLFLKMGATRCIYKKPLLHIWVKTKLNFKMGSSSLFLLNNLEKELFCLLKSLFMSYRLLF